MDVNALNALSQTGAVVRQPRGVDADRSASSQPVTATQVEAYQTGRAEPKQDAQPVESALSSIQDFVQNIQRNLNFTLDDSTGRVVVKVTDTASGEVIRQIPSEEVLKLAESLSEARSLLFQAQA
ncbi:flagellar biosynthesis protein FlaG [Pseudomonas cavernae]|uniref:Flagellar biosynthesis protein FlaG n=1 Tax=Pseudomonas cavernae TaxID=2320867 RepID=A0A385Z305_9PSED|nr:flagellar protein FlaG [Pseudomonas cavernae]AYC32517.1 flagellar biosynthesis protein FlaG [Pseudomonas cavernae]